MRTAEDYVSADAELLSRLHSLFVSTPLGGLHPGDSAALVSEVAPRSLSRRETEALIGDAHGHPLFLVELAQNASTAQQGGVVGLHWEDLLRRRLSALDRVDLLLLEIIAIAGVPLPRVVVTRAAGADPADGVARLDRLRAKRMLRSVGGAHNRRVGPFHDRVRAAVLALLDEATDPASRSERRRGLHLALGRSLLAHTAEEALDEDLFTVVSHLQRGASLMTSVAERRQLVSLSLRAANKAKLATVYQTALGYIRDAEALLMDETTLDLRFSLQKERIELEWLLGDTEGALARFATAVAQARSHGERAELYATMIELRTARAQYAEALSLAREGLRSVGVRLPDRPTKASLLRELLSLRFHQGLRTLEELESLPESHEERVRATVQLLAAVAPAAAPLDRRMISWVVLKSANLSLQYGATPHSAFGFLGYGMVLVHAFNRFQLAYEVGELGLRLSQRFGAGPLEAGFYFIAGGYLTAWVRPYAEALARLRHAMDVGLRLGDLAYQTRAAGVAASMVEMTAGPIPGVIEALTRASELARRICESDWIAVDELRLLTYDRLRHAASDPTSLRTAERSEDQLRAELSETRTPLALRTYSFCKARLCFHFGQYEEAWRHMADEAWHTDILFANVAIVNRIFYRVLIAGAVSGPRPRRERAEQRRAIKRGAAALRRWARQCPENFASRSLLAAAEAARCSGRANRAERSYQAAIAAARDQGAVEIEALALERAAAHFRARGLSLAAQSHHRQAMEAYRRWGADAKVAYLADRRP
jgi:hypothetical protein